LPPETDHNRTCHKCGHKWTEPRGEYGWCPECGPTDKIYLCQRCGFRCPHVECAGIYHCPNCGVPKPVEGEPNKCFYTFNHGCKTCGLPGHTPDMDPVPRGHPRAVFGLAPTVKTRHDKIKSSHDWLEGD